MSSAANPTAAVYSLILPFVPATTTKRFPAWGERSAASSSRVVSRPSLMPLELRENRSVNAVLMEVLI